MPFRLGKIRLGLLKASEQGCQIAYFQTKDPNLGKFWRDLQWKILAYVVYIWPFGLFYGHMIYFMVTYLVYFPVLVCCTKKNLATAHPTRLCLVTEQHCLSHMAFFSIINEQEYPTLDVTWMLGDQIGQIVAQRTIAYIRYFEKEPTFWLLFSRFR
jgi:hypothetical protein